MKLPTIRYRMFIGRVSRVLAALLCAMSLAIGAAHAGSEAKPAASSKADIVYMKLKTGRVEIRLRPDLAPNHVARVRKLISAKFYDGLTFHRVIPGFMAQTGDPKGDGTGGSKYADLKAEFSDTPFKAGTIGAARGEDPDSANSQFFICFTDRGCSHLNGAYTVWGQVTKGMEHISAIKKGDPDYGSVENPDRILRMWLAVPTGKKQSNG